MFKVLFLRKPVKYTSGTFYILKSN